MEIKLILKEGTKKKKADFMFIFFPKDVANQV